MSESEHLEVTDVQGVTVVRFRDKNITDEVLIVQLRDELTALMKPNQGTLLLLNLADVEFFASSMLNELVKLNNTVCKAGGVVRICCVSPQLSEVFKITRLDRVFDLTDSEEAGLTLF